MSRAVGGARGQRQQAPREPRVDESPVDPWNTHETQTTACLPKYPLSQILWSNGYDSVGIFSPKGNEKRKTGRRKEIKQKKMKPSMRLEECANK